MKKKAAYLIVFMVLLVSSVFLIINYFSPWNVTGDVTQVHKNETSYSITVKTRWFSGGQKYSVTIDERSDIIFDGNNIAFDELNLSQNNGYNVRAVTSDTVLFSDPPVVMAEIIEIEEK